ncbi:hypothetical protein M378DRAFT_165074 [Amanita muscaria Koide BX008]|uniref:Uncharacterized protein n=1 Tax=Amanita muscaria (strain Koide BX008) TaxID=946122 RepID=A0A0C2X2Q6_AMAMK|nr:hypothetical protein M378DRAFT_165074 [Amanita muscaria Koide BX008]
MEKSRKLKRQDSRLLQRSCHAQNRVLHPDGRSLSAPTRMSSLIMMHNLVLFVRCNISFLKPIPISDFHLQVKYH